MRRAAVLLLRSAVNSLGAEWFCADPRSMVRLRSELVRIAGIPTAVGLDGVRLLPNSGRSAARVSVSADCMCCADCDRDELVTVHANQALSDVNRFAMQSLRLD